MHLGQHGNVDYTGVIANTTPANLQEYQYLLWELRDLGYTELRVLRRSKPVFHSFLKDYRNKKKSNIHNNT